MLSATTKTEIILAGARSVIIGRQEWTAANLNVSWPGSRPPNHDEKLVATYGRLYTYKMALEIADGIFGWRLPTKQDVETLIMEAGGAAAGAANLKTGGKTGFNALYAGFFEPEDNTFKRTGQQTGFWTATSADAEEAWKFWLKAEDEEIRLRPVSKLYGDSIRLVRDK
jgi:uncharacterized protein (TIGR02145 family)